MTYLKSWEEFEKAAEKLYLQDPSKIRYSMKYVHSKNVIILKVTDDIMVIIFVLICSSTNCMRLI